MNNDRLLRILTIADTALSLEPIKRPGYLTEVCGDDKILREEVQKLLKSIDQSEDFWKHWQYWNNRQIEQLLQESKGEIQLPERIGPWKPIRLLGQGGMGTVYLADRADGQYEQQAAVKVLQRGLELGESVYRFEQERQILANLDHPNIAGLYDGGITAGGRPWLAMQFVNGIPITKYCTQNNYSLKRRLELFQKVCEAVQYAHKNLIVHRDLKPENILVTADGDVKILDFGIAKLLDDELSKAQRVQTQPGLRVMSLDYAAPEQMTGEPITTATDVYALGLLLYELLTDTYPFDLDGKNQRQIEQTLRNQDSPRPSSEPTYWQRSLGGDLDAITLKALRKEPEQRYENAGQLLDDLQRYLLNQPVSARRDTVRYRMNKFYRRHRGKLAAAMIVLIGVFSLVIYYTMQLTEERNQARQEAAKAEEVAVFLEDLFNASDPYMAAETGRPDTLRVSGFLKRGAEKVQKELNQQPLVQARMLNVVGDVYLNLGLFEEALPLLTQSLAAQLKNGRPEETAEVRESLALTLHRKGELELSEQHYRLALDLRNSHQRNSPESARTMVGLASLLAEKSAYSESEDLLRTAMDIQVRSLGTDHPDLAETYRVLGVLYHRQTLLDSAEVFYKKALDLHKKLLSDENLDLAQSLLNLSTVLREKGSYNSAEPLMQEVLNIQETLLGPEHPNTVTTMYELAILMRDKKEPDLENAANLFKRVIEFDKKQRGNNHHYVALGLFELGVTLNKMHELEQAVTIYRESLSIFRQSLPAGHPDIALALTGLGDTLVRLERPNEAETYLRESLEIRQNKFGDKAWRTGVSQSSLGWALMMQEKYEEAEKHLLKGFHILKQSNGPLRAAIARLVMLYERTEQPKKVGEYQQLLAETNF